MTETIELFSEAMSDAANGPHMGSYGQITKALMERFAEKGLTLAQLADRRMMDRSVRTLEAHAREYGLAFPDYVPYAMRRKIEFVRMGDFYEVFGDDAEPVARALGIVVTSRKGVAMCGVPVHAFDDYCAKLSVAFIVKIAKPKKERKAKATKDAPVDEAKAITDLRAYVAQLPPPKMLADIPRQEIAKRAIEIAAVGGHAVNFKGNAETVRVLTEAASWFGVAVDGAASITVEVDPIEDIDYILPHTESDAAVRDRIGKSRARREAVEVIVGKDVGGFLAQVRERFGEFDETSILAVAQSIAASQDSRYVGRPHVAEAVSYALPHIFERAA